MIFSRALTSAEIKNIYECGFQVGDLRREEVSVIRRFALYQNYPNPFIPMTTIKYSVATPERVAIKVFNCLGKEIMTLVDTDQSAGDYSVIFDATGLPSGIYFYKLQARNGFSKTRKMILMR